MKKAKLCMIMNSLSQGGAEKQFVELANRLDKKRFDVTVYLFDAREIFFELQDVTLFTDDCHSNIKGLRSLKAIFKLNRFLRSHDFDLIYTSLFWNSMLVRLALPKRYDHKIITAIRTSYSIYKTFHRFVERYFYPISHIVTNTRATANEFINLLGDGSRVFSIYNGFDINQFISHKSTDKDNVIIGTVGRQTHIKNQITLLKAVNQSNWKFSNVFVIGNPGNTTESLIEYAKHSIQSITILPAQQNIEDYYKEFDIFVLSSKYEGCPNVLFEAMLSSCMCIISEGANTDGFITHGLNGFVFDGTAERLSCLLDELKYKIGSTDWENIRRNGQQYAIEHFSMESMIDQYSELFTTIAEHNQ